MTDLARAIDEAFENRDQFDAESAGSEVRDAVDECLARLDDGSLRVAEPADDGCTVCSECGAAWRLPGDTDSTRE